VQALLLENPLVPLIVGLCVTAIAIVVWTQVDQRLVQRVSLATAIIALLVTVLLVTLSLQIETDREKIESTLHRVADALQRNDFETVYTYIHPNATEGIQRAKTELPRYKFSDARVTRIKDIIVNSDTQPRTAIAEFNVVVNVSFEQFSGRAPRFVHAYFMERDGKWLVRDYEHFEASAGFRSPPAN
jgi:type II secretory pathway pseudopilin PulG